MKPAITVNGKPLSEYSDHEIPEALAQEAHEDLTDKEQQAIDLATD